METSVKESRERRSGHERRSGDERRVAEMVDAVLERGPSKEAGAKRNLSSFFEITGSMAAAALGLYVYSATGLYSAADSAAVTFGLGALIASWFVLNFRVALHMK